MLIEKLFSAAFDFEKWPTVFKLKAVNLKEAENVYCNLKLEQENN